MEKKSKLVTAVLNSTMASAATAVALAALHSGCGHETMPASGYTTVNFGNRASPRSLEALGAMNLMDALATPRALSPGRVGRVDIDTLPTGSSAGLVVFGHRIGGGMGATVFFPTTSTTSWTVPNGAYNFYALGFGNVSGNDPWCGLAIGDDGVRGHPMVLAGTSRTVDILMGSSPIATGGADGPSGTLTLGTPNTPSCGMTPFMPPDPAGTTGNAGYAYSVMGSLSTVIFCNGSIPAGTDNSGATATGCGALTGTPPPASGIGSIQVLFQNFNRFDGSSFVPSVPPPTNATTTALTSQCIGPSGGGIFPFGSSGGSSPLPVGAGSVAAGGPAAYTNGAPAFGIPVQLALYSATGCSGFLGEYIFPMGLFSANGSAGTGLGNLGITFIDASGNVSSADNLAGFWISGTTVPTAGKLWVQYPLPPPP